MEQGSDSSVQPSYTVDKHGNWRLPTTTSSSQEPTARYNIMFIGYLICLSRKTFKKNRQQHSKNPQRPLKGAQKRSKRSKTDTFGIIMTR